MNIPFDLVNQLVAQPSESLTVEVKSWIDPKSPAGCAKIVKASLALRNRNGGFLLIGFNDKTLQPELATAPANVKQMFHVDTVQGLVSRYSSDPFEVGVAFAERDGVLFPIVVVPEGTRTVAAAKRDLIEGGKKLIRAGDVYFRTLRSNGTPSTAVAGWADWKEIIDICLDNREADIGRFVRRQLAGTDLATILSQLTNAAAQTAPPATLQRRAETLLSWGDARAAESLSERRTEADEREFLDCGRWSVALVLDPPKSDELPSQEFLLKVAAANPRLTGWPTWIDSSAFVESANRPHVKGNCWQSLIVSLGHPPSHYDFISINPVGEFFSSVIFRTTWGMLSRKRPS
jgi:hypothetical protein